MKDCISKGEGNIFMSDSVMLKDYIELNKTMERYETYKDFIDYSNDYIISREGHICKTLNNTTIIIEEEID